MRHFRDAHRYNFLEASGTVVATRRRLWQAINHAGPLLLMAVGLGMLVGAISCAAGLGAWQ